MEKPKTISFAICNFCKISPSKCPQSVTQKGLCEEGEKLLSDIAEVLHREMPDKEEHFAILSNKEVRLTGKLVEGRTIENWIKYGSNQAISQCHSTIDKICERGK